MKTFFSYFFCLVGYVGTTFSQEKKSLINQSAPPVIFQESLNKSIPPFFYKNKILVLDFWATWCAPCIANFPHFNHLAKRYGNKDVLFASITDERSSIAKYFFNRTKKQLNVIKLSDTSRKTGDSFNVLTIPYCVVIDKKNVVKWVGEGYKLTEAILDRIIADKEDTSSKVVAIVLPKEPNKPIGQRALFSFNIALSDTTKKPIEASGSATYRSNYVNLSVFNKSLGSCLEQLTGFSKSARITTNDSLRLNQLIDLNFKAGQDTSLFREYKNSILINSPRKNMIISLMGQSLKFDAKINAEVRKHYELIIADTAKLYMFKSTQNRHSSFSDDYYPKFEIVGYNLRDMAVCLEGSMKTIISTQIQDISDYDLSLDISNFETVNKTLSFQGLKLIKVDGVINCLNVSFY